jgi:hypothetical protein
MKSALYVALVLALYSAPSDAFARDSDPVAVSVISHYVVSHYRWKPSEYRIERHGSDRGQQVYWVIWLAEEHTAIPGGGKSFEVFYDQKTQRITRELGFQ